MSNIHELPVRPYTHIEYYRGTDGRLEHHYRPAFTGGLLNELTPVELPAYHEGTLVVRDQAVHAGSLPRHITRHLIIQNAEIDLTALPSHLGGGLALFNCTAKGGLVLPAYVGESIFIVRCELPNEVIPGRYVGTYFVVSECTVNMQARPEYIGGTIRTNMNAEDASNEITRTYQADFTINGHPTTILPLSGIPPLVYR